AGFGPAAALKIAWLITKRRAFCLASGPNPTKRDPEIKRQQSQSRSRPIAVNTKPSSGLQADLPRAYFHLTIRAYNSPNGYFIVGMKQKFFSGFDRSFRRCWPFAIRHSVGEVLWRPECHPSADVSSAAKGQE
ncbi:hypothetical protein, partial [Parachitinimonas caeni]